MLKAQNRHNVAFPKILDLRISSTCGGWCKAQDSVHCWTWVQTLSSLRKGGRSWQIVSKYF